MPKIKKPIKEPNNWKHENIQAFTNRYNKAINEIIKEHPESQALPIFYIPIGEVLIKMLGRFTNTWRRDIVQDQSINDKWEKLAILEKHEQSQHTNLINFTLNNKDNRTSYAAVQLAKMLIAPREAKMDYNTNSTEEVANKIELVIEPTGKLKPNDK